MFQDRRDIEKGFPRKPQFISKKTWPYFFQLMVDGKKNTDLRLADFDVHPGDVIIFQEWDPVDECYTGRELSRLVENVNQVDLLRFHTLEEIETFGHYIIETKQNVIY